ncbi:MAG: hypothetical protein HY520_00410 [Candidatus Aenigmarchaeota archaeon]|nr:hypothetical protein [Candidatus Aenigmarchaeota archaeon]
MTAGRLVGDSRARSPHLRPRAASGGAPREGMSSLISAVLVIAVTFAVAALIAPWALKLATNVSNQTTTTTQSDIICRAARYDFDSSYATLGVNQSLSGSDHVIVKVVNTGTVNLHTFSLEIEVSNSSGLYVIQLPINTSSQKTSSLPLKPGQSALLKGNVSDLNGTLTAVKVLNGVCPSSFIRQSV